MNKTVNRVLHFEPASEAAKKYNMQTSGKTKTGTLQSVLGQNDPSFEYLQLSGKNSAMSFSAVLSAKEEIILEVTEAHHRYDLPFAYYINVNGKRVYARTYAPVCDGANHYFVRIKGELSAQEVNIEFVSDCDTPIRISSVYVYCDGIALAEDEGVDEPMLLGLFSPGLSGDEQEDIRRINECKETFAPYNILCGWDIYYCRMTKEALHEQLDYILHLSKVTGVPMSFDLNSWWSGTPSGMDGLGGNFRDLDYHQVIFDPKNATGYGVYQLTTPNYWKNLPWLTLNNEHYNRIRQERLKDASEHIMLRVAQYRAEGHDLPQPVIFTENEPDYWHYGAWHDSADGIVGIEPCAIRAAALDGIELSPENGLGDAQKAWLWKNLTKYITGVGDAIAEGIGNDITVVKNGCVLKPQSLLTEHCYSHATTGESNQPYPEGKHALWETHIINSLRLGYQGGISPKDPRALEYASCYGRLAGVNKEQLKESAYGILLGSYMIGSDFQTIFNYKHCVESVKNAPKTADFMDTPVPTVTYNNQLARYDFDDKDCLNCGDTLISTSNIELATARGSRAVRANDAMPTGSITVHIHSESGFKTGLITDWRATVNFKTEDTIELGYSPDEFVLKQTLEGRNQYVGSYMTDWSDLINRDATDIYIRLTMPSGLHQTEYNAPERNSVCSFIAYSPRTDLSGHTNGEYLTFKELRLLNRLTERREDARRIIAGLCDSSDFEELLLQGRYQTAYNKAMQAVTQTLPADYLVFNNGPLGDFGIDVTASSPVRITVLEAMQSGYKIRVRALNSTPCSISVKGFAAEETESGIFILTPASGSCEIYAKPQSKPLPRELSGRIVGIKDGILRFQSQNTELTFYADSIPLTLSEDCRLYVSQHGFEGETAKAVEELPVSVSARLISNGELITEIHAQTGIISGEVTAVTEACIVGEIKHPYVTVDNGNRRVTAMIGSDCSLLFSGAEGNALHVTKIGNIGLSVGQKVTMKYFPEIEGCPYIRAAAISDTE